MCDSETIKIEERQGVTVVIFTGTFLATNAGLEEAVERFGELIETNQPKKIVADFTKVKFFSSQVLGLLLDVRRKLQSWGGQIVISGINPQLHRVFKITNLDRIFEFFPNVTAAVEKLGQNEDR